MDNHNSNFKNVQIMVALIGCLGTVMAAIISGIFLLMSKEILPPNFLPPSIPKRPTVAMPLTPGPTNTEAASSDSYDSYLEIEVNGEKKIYYVLSSSSFKISVGSVQ